MAPPEDRLEDLKGRVLAARDGLRLLPPGDPVPGATDPETGEAWDRLHVLGHVAEMLPYWTRQVRRALRGDPLGRDEEGRRVRNQAVAESHARPEERLRKDIDAACGRLLALLDRFADADLERPIQTVGGGQITLERALEERLVGHLEAHLDQLKALG